MLVPDSILVIDILESSTNRTDQYRLISKRRRRVARSGWSRSWLLPCVRLPGWHRPEDPPYRPNRPLRTILVRLQLQDRVCLRYLRSQPWRAHSSPSTPEEICDVRVHSSSPAVQSRAVLRVRAQ